MNEKDFERIENTLRELTLFIHNLAKQEAQKKDARKQRLFDFSEVPECKFTITEADEIAERKHREWFFSQLTDLAPDENGHKVDLKLNNVKNDCDCGYLTFTKKEIKQMPKYFRDIFVVDNKIVRYRYVKGHFQARYRRDGYNIEVGGKTYEIMKQRFMERLLECSNPLYRKLKIPTFAEYGASWLKVKKQLIKPSTYKEYSRTFNVDLCPVFGKYRLNEITRIMLQNYLFEFVEQGKLRTAQKIKLQLSCIFELAEDDYGINSPVKRIVLPYHEKKKGKALTKDEERKLVDYCLSMLETSDSAHALLIMHCFGLRKSEVKSIKIIDGKYLQCETSKERMGRNVVLRRIPFTPVARRVLPYVDIERARRANPHTLSGNFKRLLPNHHAHELRYTFITRCKECKVDAEVVMLWAGHSEDSSVKTSVVNRGYTDFSEEYLLAEAERVNYEF